MRPGIKAFLLSAFVFPGLGQLYNQDRRKGVALVLGTNLLMGVILLAGLVLFSQEYMKVFYPRPLTWELVKLLLLDTLSHPLFWIPFGLLMAVWGLRHGGCGPGRRAVKAGGEPIGISFQQSAFSFQPKTKDLHRRCNSMVGAACQSRLIDYRSIGF